MADKGHARAGDLQGHVADARTPARVLAPSAILPRHRRQTAPHEGKINNSIPINFIALVCIFCNKNFNLAMIFF